VARAACLTLTENRSTLSQAYGAFGYASSLRLVKCGTTLLNSNYSVPTWPWHGHAAGQAKVLAQYTVRLGIVNRQHYGCLENNGTDNKNAQ